jgi:hypothetical protein
VCETTETQRKPTITSTIQEDRHAGHSQLISSTTQTRPQAAPATAPHHVADEYRPSSVDPIWKRPREAPAAALCRIADRDRPISATPGPEHRKAAQSTILNWVTRSMGPEKKQSPRLIADQDFAPPGNIAQQPVSSGVVSDEDLEATFPVTRYFNEHNEGLHGRFMSS